MKCWAKHSTEPRVTAGALRNGGDMEVIPWDTGSLCDSDLSSHKAAPKDAGKSTKMRDTRNQYAVRIPAGALGCATEGEPLVGAIRQPASQPSTARAAQSRPLPCYAPRASAQPRVSRSRTRGKAFGPSQPGSLSLTGKPVAAREERGFEHHPDAVWFGGPVSMPIRG